MTDDPTPGVPRSDANAARTILIAGAASRDIVPDDPRGWRLGGGVSYSALTVARLGLPARAVIGVDAEAATAHELDLLREADVDVRLVPLQRGPVFENLERPDGRFQVAHQPSDPLPADSVPDAWRSSDGWLLAPVAAELPDAWAAAPHEAAFVAVGWQGLLRELVAGQPVRRLAPGPHPIIARADLAAISREDVDRSVRVDDLVGYLHDGALLVVTQGDQGGIVAERVAGRARLRHYPPVPSPAVVDTTGAGDTFLAALTAARVEPRLVGGRIGPGYDLLVAAAAASLVLEDHGLDGVADRDAVRARMTAARQARLT